MTQKTIVFLFIVPLTIFFAHFTTRYMQYFDIGINDSTRFMDIYWLRTPIAMVAQIAAVLLGNKFINDIRRRTIVNLAMMFAAICLVFFGFALFDNGIAREGGFFQVFRLLLLQLTTWANSKRHLIKCAQHRFWETQKAVFWMNLRLLHNPKKASPPFFGQACPSESIFRRCRSAAIR